MSESRRLFLAYRDAKHRVEKTMLYEDACRAADAWAAFINSTLPEEQHIKRPVTLDGFYRGETIQ